eukprot:TRINITY_DN20354_c0_g1::TRINITY_DN20354_c0_g1_i1::g.8457::m.8457 TRINITY_DN20354_c0_g1::TRINITY_DN20354_c0_g1_i1::g.8457  ORF type:complete len:258 (-),score=15.10,sp/A3BN26/PUS6_ORYSJ/29.03/2e-09,PseudoU_synth_2/PF00849.17/5.5e-14 TRINITY_DN20354_c0_g1_i1:45-818(-)
MCFRYILNRLDQPTSGLLAIARRKDFQRHFNMALASGKLAKKYRTLVIARKDATPLIQGQDITHYCMNKVRAPHVFCTEPHDQWLPCKLVITSVAPVNPALCNNVFIKSFLDRMDSALWRCDSHNCIEVQEVEIDLITGRTHQIRGQMAVLGYHIVGDDLYLRHPCSSSHSAAACHDESWYIEAPDASKQLAFNYCEMLALDSCQLALPRNLVIGAEVFEESILPNSNPNRLVTSHPNYTAIESDGYVVFQSVSSSW